MYSSAKADIDHRFFSQDGRDQIKKELLLLTDSLSNHMPSKNSKNAFERTVAKGLNFLGTCSLGLIPSEENNGGLLANIGAIVTGDPKFKILGNPESKNAFVNGILTDEDNAKEQALYMVGEDYKVLYNPSRGFLPDLLESLVDMLPFTTGIAKQVGYEMQNNKDVRYVGFSQGSLITNSAKKYENLDGKNMVFVGTPFFTNPDGGVVINSSLDPLHNPFLVFHPKSWIERYYGEEKARPILYEHIWSPHYNGVINRIPIEEQK